MPVPTSSRRQATATSPSGTPIAASVGAERLLDGVPRSSRCPWRCTISGPKPTASGSRCFTVVTILKLRRFFGLWRWNAAHDGPVFMAGDDMDSMKSVFWTSRVSSSGVLGEARDLLAVRPSRRLPRPLGRHPAHPATAACGLQTGAALWLSPSPLLSPRCPSTPSLGSRQRRRGGWIHAGWIARQARP